MRYESLKSIPTWFYEEYATTGWYTLSWFDCTDVQPGTRRRHATKANWLMLVVQTGTLQVRYRGVHYDVPAQRVLILPPGTSYTESNTHVVRLARYPLLAMNDRGLSATPLAQLPLPTVLPCADPAHALAVLDETKAMTGAEPRRRPAQRLRGNVLVNDLLLNALAGGFAAGVLPNKRPATADWVMECRDLLQANFKNPDYTIEELAATSGYSLGEVQRRFKEAFGLTPKHWLHRHRCGIAARSLANQPHLTIASIMQNSGYRSRSLFYRMFQKFIGSTPGAVRNQR